MGNSKDQDQGVKSNSNSPESKKQKRDLDVQEDVADFMNILAGCSTTSAMLEKAQLLFRTEVRYKYYYMDEATVYKEKNARAEQEKEKESSNARIAQFILGLRSTMDEMMQYNFPDWITNSNLSFVNQWKVMFHNKGSSFVQIFTKRLEKFKITEDQFFNDIKLFRSKMNLEYHEGCIPEILNDTEWNEIYRALRVRNYHTKSSLKILGTGISKEENNSTWKCSIQKNESPAVLFMKGFPYKYKESNIIQFIVPEPKDDGPNIEEVIIVKNDTGKSIGEAFVYVDTFKNAALIYSSKNEHKFLQESMQKGKKTKTMISTLKIDKPYVL